jgi:hypothetical protein
LLTTLESLEHRALLSTVTATVANGILTITGDTHNDSFSITENKGGTVTLMGTDKKTLINGDGQFAASYTTTDVIRGIVVILPGTSRNSDQVSITGLGPKVRSTVRNITITVTGTTALKLSVNNVVSSGTLTIVDGTPTAGGGALDVSVDNSRFFATSITQMGDSTAAVELGNDTINNVIVIEGTGKNDSVNIHGINRFGMLVIEQG